MRRFIERAIAKAPRMNEEQLRALLGALAEENGRMEAALDSMLDAIVVCDREHYPIIFNKSAERMLRLSGGEVTEKPLWLSVADSELASFFRDTLEDEESVLDREFELEYPGGRLRLIAVSVTALLSQGRIAGALVHAEDITEKRKREAQLRRAESLASLTTLAAGVAHEIKNPLGSISIHIQLMQKALKTRCEGNPELSGTMSRHLGVVTEEIERLNKIVVDFLFAVRPMAIELRETDPKAIVREIAEFVKPEAENAGIAVELVLDDEVPRVMLDRRYMKQAVLNLVKNAIAAMPSGGKLRLEVMSRNDEVLISVKDTGVGIPEDELPKIFEPYFTTKETGTGLGLTITFKIVKEHQGEINVDSKSGTGSMFTISLPVPQRERRLLAWDEGPSANAADGSVNAPGSPKSVDGRAKKGS